jgi:hypothetical protein
MMQEFNSLTGGCMCGAVRYSINSAPEFVIQCFCRDCQLATGTGHTTVVGVLDENFRVDGAPKTYTTTGDTGGKVVRHFCGTCGSRLFTSGDLPGPLRMVQSGTLDDPNRVTPQAAVYLGKAAHWDKVDPDLPQFEGMYPLEQPPQEVGIKPAPGASPR